MHEVLSAHFDVDRGIGTLDTVGGGSTTSRYTQAGKRSAFLDAGDADHASCVDLYGIGSFGDGVALPVAFCSHVRDRDGFTAAGMGSG